MWQGLYLHWTTHSIKMRTNIHALSGIQTDDFRVHAIKAYALNYAATGAVFELNNWVQTDENYFEKCENIFVSNSVLHRTRYADMGKNEIRNSEHIF
jgi:hypothetical protein